MLNHDTVASGDLAVAEEVPGASPAARCDSGSRSMYFSLLERCAEGKGPTGDASRAFLARYLASARCLPCELPDAASLNNWIVEQATKVGAKYHAYLAERKAGGPRRYFSNKSHALYFLKSAAPTKMVDGAWLHGFLSRWKDTRFSSLIRIYLEELGEGMPDKNHVALYRKLLASHGCDRWHNLDDGLFTQGAIQLALARHTAEYLPEVIGFNLGYEQLPLHLLITAYELNELAIDPYYFTLHVTIDNALTGHAGKAAQAVFDAMPQYDRQGFFQRVKTGYRLNDVGVGTTRIIESFDLEQEMLSIFKAKARVGALLHSDYCRVEGRTVADWLGEPGQLPAFLAGLERVGWIKRNQDPQNSRFWKLIHAERAAMFGVFSAYEQQLIHDWISGDLPPSPNGTPRQLSFFARQRLLDSIGKRTGIHAAGKAVAARAVLRQPAAGDGIEDEDAGFTAELRQLDDLLAAADNREEAMTSLTRFMDPSNHHTEIGLAATRMFAKMFG